jgi:hypothetical protein
LVVVFIGSNFQVWFGPLILSFDSDPISGCRDIQLLIF